jgi:choline-glycine betaine transporter
MEHIKPSANASDYKNFMNGWTIFYWGWWIAWAPFVGTFIAKISRGRTIKEFIAATILAPLLYVLIWFNVFGAIGIKSYRFSVMADIGITDNCATTKMAWGDFKAAINTNMGVSIDD